MEEPEEEAAHRRELDEPGGDNVSRRASSSPESDMAQPSFIHIPEPGTAPGQQACLMCTLRDLKRAVTSAGATQSSSSRDSTHGGSAVRGRAGRGGSRSCGADLR